MKLKFVLSWSACALLVAMSACSKENPTRPTSNLESKADTATVTDAATGITLTTPQLNSPNNAAEFKFIEQPITVSVKNAVSTGSTPLTYTFEVAGDAAFASKVFSRDGVAETAGTTSLRLDRLPADRSYYWRARANSGTLAGPFTSGRLLKVGPEVILQAPSLGDPANNATVGEQPTLNVNRAGRTGPAEQIFYRFEVSDTDSFGSVVYSATVPERTDLPYTPHQLSRTLDEKNYWWRVQAADPANSVTSPFSSVATFKVARGIDLKTANIVLGPKNIGDWENTARITEAYWVPDMLCIYHTRLGIWPGVPFFGDRGTLVEGNQWVFAFINGQWHGGAADWYRPGQACKGVGANSIGRDAFYNPAQEPLHSWVPRSGELFGVMSTTPSRFWPDMRTYDERTDVMVIRWP